ncbi:MAG: glycoside hydrolase family 13 protein [Clostridia bacterium]|nr:glycoside hydrolase family 13 protein [Clostridia bacterium]
MLVKLHEELTKGSRIEFSKIAETVNASRVRQKEESAREAFPSSAKLKFYLKCPREFGVIKAEMRITPDGGETEILPFSTEDGENFSLLYDLKHKGAGLFYYETVLCRGKDSLYSTTCDNTEITFADKKGTPVRLLVYEDGFTTPDWFYGGVMYHIFVDRFRKSGKSMKRADAVNENDWYAPISQYARVPGAYVKNNLFYGGDLYGVAEKLPYLQSMGVTILYLSPIFKANSNHKYDTCDYTEVDAAFGGNEALEHLISECKKCGIHIILDGVFNHTGDESIYFDKCRKYGNGAYKNPDSPYRDWYFFDENDNYSSWWGIEILPKLNHNNDNCLNYFAGENGIGAKYVKEGIGGWRLDVADELSDKFLELFRKSVKSVNPDAVIIGEVWENAADKVAYGKRRKYLQGKQLDSVMNYPFRKALLEFLLCKGGEELARELNEIYSSYPPCVANCLMNIIGTHDTERILTALGDKEYGKLSNRELSNHKMTETEYETGKKLLKIASAIQYTVYGVPSVFYGDEAGMEGGRDPFCRRAYPWERQDAELVSHYRRLGEIRKNGVYKNGEFRIVGKGNSYIAFERYDKKTRIVTAANTDSTPVTVPFSGKDLLSGKKFNGVLQPMSAVIVRCK